MSSEQKEGKEVSISVGNQVLRLWGFLCCACVYGWGRGEGVGVGYNFVIHIGIVNES